MKFSIYIYRQELSAPRYWSLASKLETILSIGKLDFILKGKAMRRFCFSIKNLSSTDNDPVRKVGRCVLVRWQGYKILNNVQVLTSILISASRMFYQLFSSTQIYGKCDYMLSRSASCEELLSETQRKVFKHLRESINKSR